MSIDSEHLSESENFLDVYGYEPTSRTMTIRREEHTIPEKVGNVRVFKGGSVLPWKLVG